VRKPVDRFREVFSSALLQLRHRRPVRRLTDFRDARLETAKRSRRKVAVIFNRVPAVFDTAHGFVFTDIMRDGHGGAQTCIAQTASWNANRRAQLSVGGH
jgi:hypothetical protein